MASEGALTIEFAYKNANIYEIVGIIDSISRLKEKARAEMEKERKKRK